MSRWRTDPPGFIFSRKEAAHCQNTGNTLTALCAAFCCKEALFKALKKPFNFDQCELFWNPSDTVHPVFLAGSLVEEFALAESIACVEVYRQKECEAIVYLFSS
jgi:4'-phosphopantetheinyl transferase EntD